MKLIMLTSTLNHHQLPICKAFCKVLGEDEFRYIATAPVSEWRKSMGFSEDTSDYPFVIRAYKDNSVDIAKLVFDADIVLYGDVAETLVRDRLKAKKLTFRYTERLYKDIAPKYQLPLRMVKYFWQFERFKNLYLLCSGAYVASDYKMTHTFVGRTFKWGYFPELLSYDIGSLMDNKAKDKTEIVWVGRMIDWKHPEAFVYAAEKLSEKTDNFHITAIGNGDMLEKIGGMIKDKKLDEYITLAGTLPTEKVREIMGKSNIALVTSDRKEGWGVVVSEAMNSGCAVIAGNNVGAAPFLIKNGENGFLFEDGNWQEMTDIIEALIADGAKTKKVGAAAYNTIANDWNAECAARNFIKLCDNIHIRKDVIEPDSPCSVV